MADEDTVKDEAMKDAADADADGSDSDSESSDMEEISPEAMERLMSLEAELEANVNLYDKHVELVQLLRDLKLRVKLREAHERMAAKFPLSPELWTEWINDELEVVRDVEDIKFVKSLFRRAAQDYLSVDVWTQYLEFVCELDPDVRAFTPGGIKAMRDLCEEALTAAGLHVTQGARIWAVYRKYEEEAGASLSGQDAEKHAERLRSLYHRQLALPLEENEQVLEEYKQWEKARGQDVPAHVAKAASRAGEGLALRSMYEEAIGPDKEPDAALLATYLAYIKLEQAQGDPSRVQVVYERAVSAFPVTVELWAQYVRWLSEGLRIPATTARVAARATRNCYWSGPLWTAAVRAVELAGQDLEALGKLRDDAMAAGMQGYEDYMEVLLSHLDAVRRSLPASPTNAVDKEQGASERVAALRAAFQFATQVMATYFPEQPDRTLRLPSYWSHCEAHMIRDQAAARKVWEEALKTPLNRYSEPWSAYAAMERGLRNVKEARGVYRRAYNRKYTDPGHAYAMCMEWLRFEREEGSAEDYQQALSKVGPILDEATAAAAAVDAQTMAQAKDAAKVVRQLSPEEMAAMRRQKDPNFKAEKGAKAAAAKKNTPSFQVPPSKAAAGKRPHGQDEGEPESDMKRARLQGPDNGGAAAPAAGHQQQQQQEQQEDEEMVGADDSQAGQHEGPKGSAGQIQRADEHTAFVRGLPIGTSEEHLKAFFKDCGPIASVRIPLHPNGEKRNFAYVDFRTSEALVSAIAKDGSCLPGSDEKLMIAKSAPPGRGGGGGRGGFGRGRGALGGHEGQESGRGRGRGYQGQDGGGRRGSRSYHDQEGRGGGRGGGRAAYGLGHAGRGRPADKPKAHLQVDGGGAGSAGGGAPKSNADFRAMLLAGKKQ